MRTSHLLIAGLLCYAASAQVGANSLPPLNIDASGTTVSGISSGGYMAVQLHVVHSARFKQGVAAIAAGPYDCAQASVLNALGRCLGNGAIPVDDLLALTRKRESDGDIDAVSHLAQSRAYIFTGAKDSVVKESVGTALKDYYAKLMSPDRIVHKRDVEVEHAFVTDSQGAECLTKATPFINNCAFDLAGALLSHLYGPLKPRAPESTGVLHSVPQADASVPSLAETAYVYVPQVCAGGAKCRLHVALHGCRQNALTIGDAYARTTGYNRWADSNQLIILYPQTGKAAVNACWDWWGYAGPDYAKKSAPQIRAIMAMIDRLSARKPD